MPTAKEILEARKAKETGPSWVPANLSIENGEYVLRFPGTIQEHNLKASSTGKSLIVTVRHEAGRAKPYPMVIKTEKGEQVLEFGSVNLNLVL